LSELSADLLCRKSGLPFSSVIINAAGRFTILAPDIPKVKQAIAETDKQVNDWLTNRTFGETIITISSVPATESDFHKENFRKFWNKMELRKEEQKYKRIDFDTANDTISDYLERFRNDLTPPLCPICGKRPSEKIPVPAHRAYTDNENASCKLCPDQIFLGDRLVHKDRQKKHIIAVLPKNEPMPGKVESLNDPIFDAYQIAFSQKGDFSDLPSPEKLLRMWDLSTQAKEGIAGKQINGYVPVCEDNDDPWIKKLSEKTTGEEEKIEKGNPKTFNLISFKAKKQDLENEFKGTQALGVFKADIDNLGRLMACGLSDDRFVLSRLTTLSRQVNNYFTIYLPHLLEKSQNEAGSSHSGFSDVYTVFAGGDDLFLIGPWNRSIDLAIYLRNTFSEYVCHNPEIHFSAGISFHKPHTPIDSLAKAAEDELEKSKHEGKNRISLFGQTLGWDEMDNGQAKSETDDLMQIKITLLDWMENEIINQAMVYRLCEIAEMAEMEKQLKDIQSGRFIDMSCAKWRSLLSYTAARNVAKKFDKDKRQNIIENIVSRLIQWINQYGNKMKIPFWYILYEER
jgi:CRISPR-associated protein Csm1